MKQDNPQRGQKEDIYYLLASAKTTITFQMPSIYLGVG